MTFECPRCDFVSTKKANFIQHINRKSQCNPSKADVSLDEMKALYKNNKKIQICCDKCSKVFNYQSNLSRHKKTCTVKTDLQRTNNDNTEMLKTILQEIQKMQANGMGNQINNTTTTQNITINITTFGLENIKHIEDSKEFLTQCFMDKNLVDIIKKIHFDDEFPQNKNVRLKSLKHGMMETFIDGKWIITDKGETFGQLLDKGATILKFHTRRNKKSIMDECDEEEQDFEELKEFIDFVQEDDDLKKPVFKKLDLLFTNDPTITLASDEFD